MNGSSVGWVVVALIAAALVGLVLLARTRWLQSDTLKKCTLGAPKPSLPQGL